MWLLREKANSRSGAGSIPDKPETSLCIRKQSSFQGQPNYCIKVIPKKKKIITNWGPVRRTQRGSLWPKMGKITIRGLCNPNHIFMYHLWTMLGNQHILKRDNGKFFLY